MVILLLGWLYISFLCLVWGNLLLDIIAKLFTTRSVYEFSITCLAGLSAIGIIAMYLSLFMPLSWKAHAIILVPAAIYCLRKNARIDLKKKISESFSHISVWGYSFLLACIVLIALINSYSIVHPDTLTYHGQIIEWFEKYKPVPGLVHLRSQFGFQSLWFASQAVFRTDIFKQPSPFFLGGAVLCWYFIFVINKINLFRKDNKSDTAKNSAVWIGWAILLAYTLISWREVRLAAASASPDFMVALYIFVSVYLFIQYDPERAGGNYHFSIIVLFCCTAASIKFSAAPLLLLPCMSVILFFRQQKLAGLRIFFISVVFILIPLLIRNIIATGYPFYPSSLFDVFHYDWKLDKIRLIQLQHYITVCARFAIYDHTTENLPFSVWVVTWWKNISYMDRSFLSSILLLMIGNIIFLKYAITKFGKKRLIILLTAFTGSLLWFIKAPDPRFGTGFLICLLYILYLPFHEKFQLLLGGLDFKKISRLFMICLFFAIISYCGYRFFYFFKKEQVLYPIGMQEFKYKKFYRNGIEMYLPENGMPCGLTPVPCVTDSSKNFIPRGNTINDGFKER